MHLKCGRFNHHQSFFDRGPAVVKSLTKGRSLGKTSECAAAAAAVVVMMMVCVCVCVVMCRCRYMCVCEICLSPAACGAQLLNGVAHARFDHKYTLCSGLCECVCMCVCVCVCVCQGLTSSGQRPKVVVKGRTSKSGFDQ